MQPDYASLLAHVDACVARGALDDAEPALRQIVGANPREHYAWSLLGLAALRRGDPASAESLIRRALEIARNNPEYLNLLGVACGEQGRFDEALAALRRSLKARPAFAEAHYNTGKVLHKQGDLKAARDAFRRAASIDPRYPGARQMLGLTLQQLGEPGAAVRVLEDAVADDPHDEGVIVQLGKAYMATRGQAAAIELYRVAAARLPSSGVLRRNLAVALLAAGEFAEGWRDYLGRDLFSPAARERLPDPLPADLGGKTVLLRWEQGLGDILFFLRFAPALAARGAKLSLSSPARLAALLTRTGLFERIVDETVNDVGADLTLMLGDLPHLVGSTPPPAPLPLRAIESRVHTWRERLAALGPRPYVGVTWRAGTDFRRTAEFGRSIHALFKEVDPVAMIRAAARAGGTLVSLQRMPDADETTALARAAGVALHDASTANDDLDDALALLDALDEYVGVSNTNMHLRAGLGRNARVLVPFPAEYRWMAAGDESPWFPGFRVYRQSAGRDWSATLHRLAEDLAAR